MTPDKQKLEFVSSIISHSLLPIISRELVVSIEMWTHVIYKQKIFRLMNHIYLFSVKNYIFFYLILCRNSCILISPIRKKKQHQGYFSIQLNPAFSLSIICITDSSFYIFTSCSYSIYFFNTEYFDEYYFYSTAQESIPGA